ncbi:MAG: hypothetical protein IKJ78_03800, partial [Bacteroidales bacterium]|nr:hypothetical protein [Bacteroidales bacterium]
DTRYLSLLIRFKQLSLFSTPSLRAKADAKIQPFSIPPKYFLKKIAHTSGKRCVPAPPGTKKIHPGLAADPSKQASRTAKTPKMAPLAAEKAQKTRKTRAAHCRSARYSAQDTVRATPLSTAAAPPAAHRLPYGAPTAVLQ